MKKVFWGMVHPFSFMKLEWPKCYQKRGCMFFQTVWHSLVNENLGSIDRISLSRFPEVSPMHTARDTVAALPHIYWYRFYTHLYVYLYRFIYISSMIAPFLKAGFVLRSSCFYSQNLSRCFARPLFTGRACPTNESTCPPAASCLISSRF